MTILLYGMTIKTELLKHDVNCRKRVILYKCYKNYYNMQILCYWKLPCRNTRTHPHTLNCNMFLLFATILLVYTDYTCENEFRKQTLKNFVGEVGLYGWLMSKLIMEVDSDWGSQSDSVWKLHSVETLIWSKLLVEREEETGRKRERERGRERERMLCHCCFCFFSQYRVLMIL